MTDHEYKSPFPARLAQILATSGLAGSDTRKVLRSELVALRELWLHRVNETQHTKQRYLFSQWQELADRACTWVGVHEEIPTWTVLYSGADAFGAVSVRASELCRMIQAWPIRHYDLVITTRDALLGMHLEHNFNAHQEPVFFPEGPIEVIAWDLAG